MIVTEESAKIKISKEKKISKKLPVFYNPVMKLNRDVSILLLNSVSNKDMQIALPLAGSGIRGIRFLQELKKGKIKSVSMNDYKTSKNIKENLKLNKLTLKNIFVYSKDANLFLLESKGFDYIDIDPFGTPNPFLESAIVRLARNGILAVTATDTSALAGSSPTACQRKYWSKPLKNHFMHETGIRILIRKVQLIGAQFEKALTPIFSFYADHYYKVFFRCDKGRKKADEIIKQHSVMKYENKEYGPIWIGKLWDEKLVEKMYKNHNKNNKKLSDLISIIKDECKINTVGFYDLHKLSKQKKIAIPKIELILKKDMSRTHFLGWGIRSKKAPI